MSGTLYDFLDRQGVQALVRLVPASRPFEGAKQLVATCGLGTLIPNTILVGNSEQAKNRQEYCRMVARFHAAAIRPSSATINQEGLVHEEKSISGGEE